MAGPGDEMTPAESQSRGGLRASYADREQVIGILKAAFVQGRLTEDELGGRVDRAYASRTCAELAEVTADIPAELAGAQPPRNPWRATKLAWRVEYAIFLPGIVAFLLLPGGPHTTVGEVVILAAAVYLVFWILGVCMMVASRPAADAGGGDRLHVSHAVAREQVIRILRAAWAQGRLTEDEHDARTAQVSVSRSQADLAALIADLPAGLAARPPAARDVRAGICVIIAAASVLAAIVLWRPDNYPAFAMALFAAASLIVAPVMTVGLMVDARHQKRLGGQLPPGPTLSADG